MTTPAWTRGQLRDAVLREPRSRWRRVAEQVGATLLAVIVGGLVAYYAVGTVLALAADRDCKMLGYGGGGWSLGKGYCLTWHYLDGPQRR